MAFALTAPDRKNDRGISQGRPTRRISADTVCRVGCVCRISDDGSLYS